MPTDAVLMTGTAVAPVTAVLAKRYRRKEIRTVTTVLILSEPSDVHAIAVAEELKQKYRIPTHILRMGDFPSTMQAGFQNYRRTQGGYVCVNQNIININEIRSVWWRRPGSCEPPEIFTGLGHGEFVRVECNHFMQGLFWSRRCLWVNDPMRDLFASRKIVQLTRAKEIGFRIPRTIVTNNPRDVRAFVKRISGRVIFKRVGASSGMASKTSFLSQEYLEDIDTIAGCPTIFQEYIEGNGDLRIIWIDGECWSFHIASQSGASPEDSRFDLTVAHTPYNLPVEMQNALNRFMYSLGLVFGAIDMRIGTDGEYYFLEVNPSGQFAYLETKTGLPLANGLASVLARGDPSGKSE